MSYLEINELANGNLELSIPTTDGREAMQSAIDSGYGFWQIMADSFEQYKCNGSYTHFDASDGNPFVGITSAPCIAECMDIDDDGTQTIEGRHWYFNDYFTKMETEILAAGDKVIYTLAR